MTVTICWRPIGQKNRRFNKGVSSQLNILHDIFGTSIPIKAIFTLRAMEKVCGTGFYGEVADILEKHGEINVWGSH